MIPQGFIQDLIARADIVDVVGRHVVLKKAGINYKGLCPFHGEKSPSFIVSPSRQTYHCFGCGVHGNALGFLMEHGALPFVEAVHELAGELGVAVPDDPAGPEERARAAQARAQRLSLTEVMAKATQHYRDQLKQSPRAIDYLKRRGLTGQIAARFALGYAPAGKHSLASCFPHYDDPQLVEAGLVIHKSEEGEEERRYDRFRDRVMFPIRNPKGEVIGFGGRILDSGEPKYLNSPETPLFVKGRELYGLFEARAAIRERNFVLVTEGYMDVVALAQLGVPNAVATLGTACTGDHVAKLLRFTEDIVFSFDGDAAGRRAAGRAMEAVLPHASDTRRFRFLFLPSEHDPDSYIREHGTEAFERCIQEALPLSSQLVQAAREGCDLTTPEGRARMLAQARPLVELLPQGLLREQLRVELARDGQIAPEVLAQHWADTPTRHARAERREPRGRSTGHEPPAHTVPDDGMPVDYDLPYEGPPPEAHYGSTGYTEGSPRRREGWPRKERGAWSGERSSSDRWRRKDAPPPGPPPRTPSSRLDRTAWLLLHHSALWMELPHHWHDLLVERPMPHGPLFAALDRITHDQGSLPTEALIKELQAEFAHDDVQLRLLAHIGRLIDVADDADTARGQLHSALRDIELALTQDHINTLSAKAQLTPEDVRTLKELNEQFRVLKQGGPVGSPD